MAREKVLEILESCRRSALSYSNIETHRKWNSHRQERLTVKIQKDFDCLTVRQKKIIVMFYLEGKTWEQIAQKVRYSPQQCQYICQRAVDRLANEFVKN